MKNLCFDCFNSMFGVCPAHSEFKDKTIGETASMIWTGTYTASPKCEHKNGWYQRIYYRGWFKRKSHSVFICSDCQEIYEFDGKGIITKPNFQV
jgi:hypothetical protein